MALAPVVTAGIKTYCHALSVPYGSLKNVTGTQKHTALGSLGLVQTENVMSDIAAFILKLAVMLGAYIFIGFDWSGVGL